MTGDAGHSAETTHDEELDRSIYEWSPEFAMMGVANIGIGLGSLAHWFPRMWVAPMAQLFYPLDVPWQVFSAVFALSGLAFLLMTPPAPRDHVDEWERELYEK